MHKHYYFLIITFAVCCLFYFNNDIFILVYIRRDFFLGFYGMSKNKHERLYHNQIKLIRYASNSSARTACHCFILSFLVSHLLNEHSTVVKAIFIKSVISYSFTILLLDRHVHCIIL